MAAGADGNGSRERAIPLRVGCWCDEQGLKEQAERTMAGLAGRADGGFAPARLWLANRVLKQPQPSQSELQGAIAKLEAVVGDANSPIANALFAQTYVRLGQDEKAEPYLMKSIQWFPHLRVPLARILVNRQQADKARWQLEQATKEIRFWLTRTPMTPNRDWRAPMRSKP